MALQHNSGLLPVAEVLPHEPPRLWLDGVTSVEEVPLEQYRDELDGAEDPASILERYANFRGEEPAQLQDTIVRAQGFWTPAPEQFDGHFPGRPILQGVQQLESVAQLGGYAEMRKSPGKLGVLFGNAYINFSGMALPGETLLLSADIIGRDKRLFVGIGSVALEKNGEVTASGIISGSVMKQTTLDKLLQSVIDSRA